MPTTASSTTAATGEICYDADGTGGAAANPVRHRHPGTALTNADFFAY